MWIGSNFEWHLQFLSQFNLPAYQPPQHPWYWNFRWIGFVIAIRAVFWLAKQLPKENKSLQKPVQKPSNASDSAGPAVPVALEQFLPKKSWS